MAINKYILLFDTSVRVACGRCAVALAKKTYILHTSLHLVKFCDVICSVPRETCHVARETPHDIAAGVLLIYKSFILSHK